MTCYTLPPAGRDEFGIGVSGFGPLLGREAIEEFWIDAAEDIKLWRQNEVGFVGY